MSFVQERPDECPICFEDMNDKRPLKCGHWVHMTCIEKSPTHTCPLCRVHVPPRRFSLYLKEPRFNPNIDIVLGRTQRNHLLRALHRGAGCGHYRVYSVGIPGSELYYIRHRTRRKTFGQDRCIIILADTSQPYDCFDRYEIYSKACPLCDKNKCIII
jgi:hypothetical protein